jgi:hypothetical protein
MVIRPATPALHVTTANGAMQGTPAGFAQHQKSQNQTYTKPLQKLQDNARQLLRKVPDVLVPSVQAAIVGNMVVKQIIHVKIQIYVLDSQLF